jgi:hypothetical protein
MIASIKSEMQDPRLAGSVRDDQFNRASPNPAEHQRCSSLAPLKGRRRPITLSSTSVVRMPP